MSHLVCSDGAASEQHDALSLVLVLAVLQRQLRHLHTPEATKLRAHSDRLHTRILSACDGLLGIVIRQLLLSAHV